MLTFVNTWRLDQLHFVFPSESIMRTIPISFEKPTHINVSGQLVIGIDKMPHENTPTNVDVDGAIRFVNLYAEAAKHVNDQCDGDS